MANGKCNAPSWSNVYDRLQGKPADGVCGKGFRVSQPDQTECIKCGGRTRIDILADQTIRAVWTGPRKRGSLFQIGASGNADYVNRLDKLQLWAVLSAAKQCPFPMGDYESVYRIVLKSYQETGLTPEQETAATLGEFRKYVVVKAGEGINAPTDSYLRAACTVVESLPQVAPGQMSLGFDKPADVSIETDPPSPREWTGD